MRLHRANDAGITGRWHRVRNAPWPRFVFSSNSRTSAARVARALPGGTVDTFAAFGGPLVSRYVWSQTFKRWTKVHIGEAA